ncbi:hypothetical protein Vi05172_g13349 [Venturia inaequalis]|jgi:NADH:ubiquinone oxidoreductase subunit H|nr:hypothetical protein Vi05172_g13349 [Venturia inaequalis]
MLYLSFITSILEVIVITVPALLIVAYVTVAERKTMASMQRRLGPNVIGQHNKVRNNPIKFIPRKKKSYSYIIYTPISFFLYEKKFGRLGLFLDAKHPKM